MTDDDQSEQQHIANMAAFAEREGLALSMVFVEKRWQRTLALNALTAHCQAHDIRHVIVPTSERLSQLPVLADVSKEVLEQDIDGQVWIVAPTEDESSCAPTLAENGGDR
jgi:predicted RNA-binding protein with PUA-like domain